MPTTLIRYRESGVESVAIMRAPGSFGASGVYDVVDGVGRISSLAETQIVEIAVYPESDAIDIEHIATQHASWYESGVVETLQQPSAAIVRMEGTTRVVLHRDALTAVIVKHDD